jgi:hypothetical protein
LADGVADGVADALGAWETASLGEGDALGSADEVG